MGAWGAWRFLSGPRLGASLALGVLAVGSVVAAAPASAAPRRDEAPPATSFHMPFPCGQEWRGTTRSSHSPSTNSVDWNRADDDGDDVVAAAAGTVDVAVPDGKGGYGNWVRVTHLDGESTIYAHLKSVAVTAGQAVDQGALLGLLGTTGNSTGPHLHFEERDSSGVRHPWFGGERFVFGSTQASTNCVDHPVAGDFLGDAAAEVAVYRRADPAAFLVHRAGKGPKRIPFGLSTDQPVVGDWDGDGRVNPGVRTPLTKTFALSTPAGVISVLLGKPADLPVAGDWDGDGVDEIGVRRPKTSTFRLRAGDASITAIRFGDPDDLPVTGDWNGDGTTDLGVFDLTTATFTLRLVDADGLAWFAQVQFGGPGDLPVTGDWDANGRTDVGVWDPDTGTFLERRAAAPTAARARVVAVVFGTPRG